MATTMVSRGSKTRHVAHYLANTKAVIDHREVLLLKLYMLAERQDLDEDPGALAQAVDAVLDSALDEFQAGNTDQGVSLIVGAAATIDTLLDVLGVPDSDDAAEASKRTKLLEAHRMSSKTPAEMAKVKGGVYRSMGYELRQKGDGATTGELMIGHFARFNEWTEILSMWEGEFMEQIAPGAFTETIASDRAAMKVLFNHGRDPSVGMKVLGSIDQLEEDQEGARYEVPLLTEASYVRDLLPGLRLGPTNGGYGASFRFEVLQDMWNEKPKVSDYNPRALPERTILKTQVMEFGPVTFPAYQGATSGLASRSLRSLTDLFHEAGRLDTGSVSGGNQHGLRIASPTPTQVAAIRDRDLRMKGVI